MASASVVMANRTVNATAAAEQMAASATSAAITLSVSIAVLVLAVTFAVQVSGKNALHAVKTWWTTYTSVVADYRSKEAQKAEMAGGNVDADEDAEFANETGRWSALSVAAQDVLNAQKPKWYNLPARFARFKRWLFRPSSLLLLRAALRAPLLEQLVQIFFQSIRLWLSIRRTKGVGGLVDLAIQGALTRDSVVSECSRVLLMLFAEVAIDAAQLLMTQSIGGGSFRRQLSHAFLSAILRQDLLWLSSNRPWELSNTMNRGSSAISRALSLPLTIVKDSVTLAVIGYEIFHIDWQLALITVGLRLFISNFVSSALSRHSEFLQQLSWFLGETKSDETYQIFGDIKSYQLFASEDVGMRRVEVLEIEAAAKEATFQPVQKATQAANRLCSTVQSLVRQVGGAYRIVCGSLTMGKYTELQSLESEFLNALDSLNRAMLDWNALIKDSKLFFAGLIREPVYDGEKILAPGETAAQPDDAKAAEAGKPKKDPIAVIDAILKERSAAANKAVQDLSALDLIAALKNALTGHKKEKAAATTTTTTGSADLTSSAAAAGTSSTATTSGGKPVTPPLKGRIELRNVSFKYPPKPKSKDSVGFWMSIEEIQAAKTKEREEEEERQKKPPVLDDVTIEIPAGTSCALVGKSGSGKTTLFQLLVRFYDAGRGQVLIDGKDIREYDLPSLRKQIATVEQTARVFNGTLAENLCFGLDPASPDYPTREQMEVACKRASFMDVLEKFPKGFDEVLGDKGRSLSGGQAQRLSIARAFIRNPSILLLDEITSAQDVESEVGIQAGIAELMKGRTVVMIAHRLKTIEHAQQILLLADGKITERGTHESLYRAGGKYKWMVDQQALSRPGQEGDDDEAMPNQPTGGGAASGSSGSESEATASAPPASKPAAAASSTGAASMPPPPSVALVRSLSRRSSVLDDQGSVGGDSDTDGENATSDGLAKASAEAQAALRDAQAAEGAAAEGKREEAIAVLRTLSNPLIRSLSSKSSKTAKGFSAAGSPRGGKCVCGCALHNPPTSAWSASSASTAPQLLSTPPIYAMPVASQPSGGGLRRSTSQVETLAAMVETKAAAAVPSTTAVAE